MIPPVSTFNYSHPGAISVCLHDCYPTTTTHTVPLVELYQLLPLNYDHIFQEQVACTSTTAPSDSNYTYSPACVLKSKPLAETVNSKLDTLFCAYSFSHDNNWVIAALTDSTGHLLDSAVFAVDQPARYSHN